ncbi:MAG: MBL fold metallo-hydrolase [Alphaproteobacteria bacterium]|nr:MBL fold metallo-hydrolase [Alphaproteobacteria bacterium]
MSAPTDDTIVTAKGALEVHAVHHASFMLSWNGLHVLVDPAPVVEGSKAADPTAEYRALPKPDVILITHIHFDHFNIPILEAVAGPDTEIVSPQNVYDAMPDDLKAKTRVMKNGDKSVIDTIPVTAMPMYNTTPDRVKFHPKGLGDGYILTFGGRRVYIAGDTEETPELAHLSHIDVAFVPMNLPYTETVEAAAKWVRDFRPKVVYPYHYHNADGTLSDVNAFKKEVGGASDVRLLQWY